MAVKTKSKSRNRDDDEPKTKKRSRRDDDEDEDEEDEDQDDDEDEDEDEDEKPSRRANSKSKNRRDSDDDDDSDDEEDDEDEDERPAKKKKSGEKKRKLEKVYTPKFRVSYAHVFEPHAFKEGEPKKYMLDMIFSQSADLTELEAAIDRAGKAAFGKDWPKIKKIEPVFKDGNDKPDIKAYKDKIIAKAKSNYKPGIVDQDNNPIDDDNQEDFYSGCYATATVFPFAYTEGRNKGVTLILGNLKKLKDGEHLGGRTSARQDFENVGDVDDQDDDEDEDEAPRKKKSKTKSRRSRDDDDEDED